MDSALLVEDQTEVVVQVNGRVRGRLRVAPSVGETEVMEMERADTRVAAHLEGRSVRKTVYLPGKLINIVVG